MDDPFWSASRRLARADKHIADLKREIDAYLRTQPYAPVREIQPDGTHEFHKLRIVRLVPDIITDCAFDAVTNLRASLDNAAYAIALSYAPNLAKNVHFPVADTASQLKGDLRGAKGRPFPPDIRALLCGLQPHEGGHNHFVWALNKVRNQAEHRFIVRCLLLGGFDFSHRRVISGDVSFFNYIEGSEDEIVFAIASVGAQFEYDLNFAPFKRSEAISRKSGADPLCRPWK